MPRRDSPDLTAAIGTPADQPAYAQGLSTAISNTVICDYIQGGTPSGNELTGGTVRRSFRGTGARTILGGAITRICANWAHVSGTAAIDFSTGGPWHCRIASEANPSRYTWGTLGPSGDFVRANVAAGDLTQDATCVLSAPTSLPTGGGGGASIAGLDIQIAPVSTGVYQTLTGWTAMSRWTDGVYNQDFWRASNNIDGMTIIASREVGTDRFELWLYRPPVKVFRPLDAFSWAPTVPSVTSDLDYDVRISVNGSLVQPQLSGSTTTRVRMATGTIRRLCTAFKSWDWARVDAARTARRVQGHNVNRILFKAGALPTGATTVGTPAAYSHATLGGSTSENWYDGNRAPSGGDWVSSRAPYHAWEAMALSDRFNSVTTHLAAYETALRRAAEYSGAFPQWHNLDPLTLRPIDPIKGAEPYTNFPGGGPNFTPRGCWYVPARSNYGWDTAHLYNNGHLAFEATRDPFFALLQQQTALIGLAECTESSRTGEAKLIDPNITGGDQFWTATGALPFYILSTLQYRARAWAIKEVAKARAISTQCPTVDFLRPLAFWDVITADSIIQQQALITRFDNAVMPGAVNSEATDLAARAVYHRTLGLYDYGFDEGADGAAGRPIASYHSAFMSEYMVQALTYAIASGSTGYTAILDKAVLHTLIKATQLRGEKATIGLGSLGGSVPLAPGNRSSGVLRVNAPMAWTTPATWEAYWNANDTVFNAAVKTRFLDPNWSNIMIRAVFCLKELNDAGVTSIRVTEVNAAVAALQTCIDATPTFLVSNDIHAGRAPAWT